jgi:protein tyrosine/serine phosphatase
MADVGYSIIADQPRRRLMPTILFFSLVLLAIIWPVAWNNGVRDQFVARNFGVVEEGKLYRSGQISSRLIESTLRQYGIKSIVALAATGMKPIDNQTEEQAAKELGIEREVFPLSGDGTGRVEEYAAAIAAIDRAVHQGKPVLVHCVAGAQRTGGVIAAYHVLVEKRCATEAFAEMRRFGHDPHDNPHLLDYLNSHMSELAQRLVELGVINHVPDPVPVIRAD